MQEGRYNLTNDEFHAKISKSFKTIYQDKKYTNVTLATADEKQIKAHKVILSSFSPFFEKILEANPHEHPLIFLKGIKYRDLESLMQFAYLGECEVDEDHLQEFLEAGKDLQISGLAEFSMNPDGSEIQTVPGEPPEKKRKVSEEEVEDKENLENDDAEQIEIMNSDDYVDQFDEMPLNMVQQMMEGADMSFDHSSDRVKSESPAPALEIKGKFSCDRCTFQTTLKHCLRRHIRSVHDGIVYKCEECDFTTKRTENLKDHRDSKHLGITYQCLECGIEYPSKYSLTSHKKKHHSTGQ